MSPTHSHLAGASVGAEPFRVFVGYDSGEDIAYRVCRHSLLRRSSIPLEVIPIVQQDLRESGLYWRDRDPTESTEFSFTRFLTPHLDRGLPRLGALRRLRLPLRRRRRRPPPPPPPRCTRGRTGRPWCSSTAATQRTPPRSRRRPSCQHQERRVPAPLRLARRRRGRGGPLRVELPRGPQQGRPGRCGRHGAARDTLHVRRLERYRDCEFADLWVQERDAYEAGEKEKDKVVDGDGEEDDGVKAAMQMAPAVVVSVGA
ncbi:unnamed protein product [Urochloa decumbens]|uniref:TIR domain-containing protein n=1 Tax=Urochloa decumbens TaxID=240449 RepID=A0ABC9EF53_9POAL